MTRAHVPVSSDATAPYDGWPAAAPFATVKATAAPSGTAAGHRWPPSPLVGRVNGRNGAPGDVATNKPSAAERANTMRPSASQAGRSALGVIVILLGGRPPRPVVSSRPSAKKPTA